MGGGYEVVVSGTLSEAFTDLGRDAVAVRDQLDGIVLGHNGLHHLRQDVTMDTYCEQAMAEEQQTSLPMEGRKRSA